MTMATLPAPAAFANNSPDPDIETAKLCTRSISRYERHYGIPSHLLSAIAATESGRYNRALQLALPWPWTINAEGQGQYFASKAEAVRAVRQLQAQGVKSIDIGCMQVNLVHHADAFASLDDAFDPERNIAYAASFLRTLYEENQSWKQAAAFYHSRTPARGVDYAGRVYSRWTNIVDRLRTAKAEIPETTMAALNNREMPASPVMLSKVEPKVIYVQPSPLPEQRGKQVARHQAPRMNSISVSNPDNERDHGVLVIRPKITAAEDNGSTMTIAQTTPVSGDITNSRVIQVADKSPSTAARLSNGPKFIFEN
jgi:hypothetical protein